LSKTEISAINFDGGLIYHCVYSVGVFKYEKYLSGHALKRKRGAKT